MAWSGCANFVLGSRTVISFRTEVSNGRGLFASASTGRILSLAAAVPAGAQSNSSITDLDYSLMRILIS